MNQGSTALPSGVQAPDVWLRPFYNFNAWEAGYIGWTREAGRAHMMRSAKSGDLMLIYGAGSKQTDRQDRGRVLGFLQIELTPIRDVDRSSPESIQQKIDDGYQNRWTFALPVRRAWILDSRTLIGDIAFTTYQPKRGRALAQFSEKLTDEEVRRVMSLPVTEVDVYGETPVAPEVARGESLAESLSPSRGVTPIFGTRQSEYVDGNQRLYIALFEGDAAALLTPTGHAPEGRSLVKIGYTNDPQRREGELNRGFPPAVQDRWRMWHTSPTCPDGATALDLETELKARCNERFHSLGGEFFLADRAKLKECFDDVVKAHG